MAITCKLIMDGLISVNEKELLRDMDGAWKSKPNEELNVGEAKAAQLFIKASERYGFDSGRVTWFSTPKVTTDGND